MAMDFLQLKHSPVVRYGTLRRLDMQVLFRLLPADFWAWVPVTDMAECLKLETHVHYCSFLQHFLFAPNLGGTPMVGVS